MDERGGDAIWRGDLTRLLDKVRDRRGIDLTQYRFRYLERRIGSRLGALGLSTYRQYASYLDGHPEEYARLLNALTISVTQFFRDPSVFEYLRATVLPSIIKEKRRRAQRTVRVWSAGCATGEEAYSLGMCATEAAAASGGPIAVRVTATDIDREALARARLAEYPVAQLEQVPKRYRERYVELAGDVFRIVPEVAQAVRFQYLDLFEGRLPYAVDLVVCRNVFIYLSREQQERLLRRFWETLGRGGYLVLGRSERLAPALADRFALAEPRERVYRRVEP
jgi:chemotaxis methyl-accepting protein methylase